MTRQEAYDLVTEWVKNEHLIGHMVAVEAAMRFYAKKFGQDEELWGIAGLLHDADWEAHPEEHPQKILQHLRDINEHGDIIRAINAHGGKGATPPTELIDKALFACDELSGFVVAVARVRPDKLSGMEVSSVKKKLKTASFAAPVSREDINKGAEMLNIPLDEHIANVIAALQAVPDKVGL